MFDTLKAMEAAAASLHIAALRGRPVAMANTRLMEVPGPLAGLFPEGGIRKGSTVSIAPASGGVSLALALAGTVTGGGGWAVAVGLPSLGLVAAAEMGVRMDHLALIPDPGGRWAVIVASLVDGFDLVLLRPPGPVKSADVRRLAARTREKGTVLVLLGGGWPESPDMQMAVTRSDWVGLEAGNGQLQARRMEVVLSGRRVTGRERRTWLWLPGSEPVAMLGQAAGAQREEPSMAASGG